MNIIRYPQREKWDSFCKRPQMNRAGLDGIVNSILGRVKNDGVKHYLTFRRNMTELFSKT